MTTRNAVDATRLPDIAIDADAVASASRLPLVVIVMAQVLMIFNVSTLQVSLEGIASSFGRSATDIGAAIITYALTVAALILLGARVAQLFGSRRVFRISVLAFGAGMLVMGLSPVMSIAIVAQVIAGAAAAVLAPSLVILVADNYRSAQRDQALAWLGAAPALGVVLAFLLAGSLSTWTTWRFMFGLLVALAALVYKLGSCLSSGRRESGVSVDGFGAALAAAAILSISIGASNLTDWGVLLRRPSAPFGVMDMSPAPILILCGIFLLQAFIAWSRRMAANGRTPLIALEVIDTRSERAALFAIFVISALASAITFLLPLYIQVVQGGSSLQTAVAVIPFSVASFIAAILVVHLYDRLGPRRVARAAFLAVAIGTAMLGAVVRNDWGEFTVIFSMAIAGLGEGALVTLLFNVVVSASPKHLAGDVGSVRGATNNLATAIGTAIVATLVVGILSSVVHVNLVHNPHIPVELKTQVDLDSVAFVSNEHLRRTLSRVGATDQQTAEAVQVNTDARLIALKVTLFSLAGIALLAYFPAGALPSRIPVPRRSPVADNAAGSRNDSAAFFSE